MSTRTPAQIAEATVEGFESDDRFKVKGMTYHIGYPLLKDMLIDAIKEDRAQRTPEGSPLIAAVADAIQDRGALAAAQLIRDTDPEDDLWNNYVGPMLDSLEDDYTAIAKESAE